MRLIPRHLRARLGRRGAFLTLVGFLWIVQGLAVLQGPAITANAALLHERIPVPIRVALWIGTGLTAMVLAWRRSPGQDSWGFIALVAMPLERALSFLYGYLMWLLPGDMLGYDRGLIGGSAWLSVAAAIVVVAGWPEPGGYAPPRRRRG